jgi:UDP-GlcNAc:undecaprenyl-phosphate GlcNAc-1-phosphate transferase
VLLTVFLALSGAAVAALVGRHAMAIGQRLQLLDFPDPAGGRKLHATVTPLVGGVALLVAVLVAGFTLLALAPAEGERPALIWFLVTVTGMAMVGLADDRFGLTARTRLLVAASLIVAAAAQVPDFRLAFLVFAGQERLVLLPGIAGVAFTLLCLVGFLNAVNMADGKNGLVIGQALIWSAVLLVRLPANLMPMVAAIAGALLVLFWYNMRGRLFLGDCGSYGLSAMFGLLAVYGWNLGFPDMRADDIALIFAVPVFDTLRLIVHRTLAGKTPFTPGRDHLHHYLHARWGWPRPLPWVLALVAIPNAGAILWPGTGLIWLGVTLAGYFALLRAATAPRPTQLA